MSISFHFLDIPKFKWKVIPVKKWLQSIAVEEGFNIQELDYIFCTDDYLLDINIQHLDHHTLTDIITFDLSDEPTHPDIEGEIYISWDRILDNAKTFEVPTENELSRVMAHGVLHLCGYKDKSPDDEKTMREKENYYIRTSPLLQ